MGQNAYADIIRDQTERALWEVGNVMDCVAEGQWSALYCNMPVWKHLYHMIHSLDVWFINPRDPGYVEPVIHQPGMNDLDAVTEQGPDREALAAYFHQVACKIRAYVDRLRDDELLTFPRDCEYSRFTLILAQYRHLHTHMGMVMGFIVAATGKWPRVVGLEGTIPTGDYERFT